MKFENRILTLYFIDMLFQFDGSKRDNGFWKDLFLIEIEVNRIVVKEGLVLDPTVQVLASF